MTKRLPEALMVVALFAGLDFNLQIVSRRWQRTGGEGSESTRRILGLVEIKHRCTVDGLIGVKESSRLISLAPIRSIAEDNKQLPIFFLDRLQRTLFSFESELQSARAFHLEFSAEDIRNHHLLRLWESFESGCNFVTFVDGK